MTTEHPQISSKGFVEATKFKLSDYVCAVDAPANYTLALLDKSFVLCNLVNANIPIEILPFIHPKVAKSTKNPPIEVKSFLNNGRKHFVVVLNHRKSILRSAKLTEVLLLSEEVDVEEDLKEVAVEKVEVEEEKQEEMKAVLEEVEVKSQEIANIEMKCVELDDDYSDDDNSDNDNNEWDTEDSEYDEDAGEYLASMVLFPVDDDPEKMLAYLLGHWMSLLNMTAISPLFGLKIVTSFGVASTIEDADQELCNIKEILKGTLRHPKLMRGSEKSGKGFSRMAEFEIDPASNELERVRLMPIADWGRALITGDDLFKFRLNSNDKNNSKTCFSNLNAMHVVAIEIYNIYLKQNIHKDFSPYVEEPVVGQIAEYLNKQLEEKWKLYFNGDKLLYIHWTFWLRFWNHSDYSSIINNIIEKGFLETVEVDGEFFKTAQFVRSLPIQLNDEEYYRFDRGRWFRMPASRFEVIEKEIVDVTVSHKSLCLPKYVYKKDEKNYQEYAYNIAAVKSMRKKYSDLEAILLDREMIALGGNSSNKFEFADILVQQSNGRYFLIHVKRETANDIDHHRVQVERCALYLCDFGRKELPGLLVTDILKAFCDKYKMKKSSSYRLGKSTEKGFGAHKKKGTDFRTYLVDNILKMGTKVDEVLKNTIASNQLESIMAKFEPYEDVLCRCLDAIRDFISWDSKRAGTSAENNISKDQYRIDIVKKLLESVLERLKKHHKLIKYQDGLLPKLIRDKITIVLAIIKDGTAKNMFPKQQLWGMEQTKRLVEKKGFKFIVTYIPDATVKQQKKELGDLSTSNISTVNKDANETKK